MATKMRRARVQDADDELVVMLNLPTKLLKLRSHMNARNKTCAAADQIVTKVPVVQSMNVTKVPLSCCACGAHTTRQQRLSPSSWHQSRPISNHSNVHCSLKNLFK
jgi:hypothetical protein